MRALMVDDSRANRLVVRNFLIDLGFVVTEATDAADGMKCLGDLTRFDLILVNWGLRGINGLDFIRHARAIPASSDIPIILMGDENSRDQLVDAIDAGASEYLMRPFSKQALATKLELLGMEHR
jgi:two-component system, chemotaxis family, chemotaxis protein CheY